jgi:FKBP-type peptidyl-prolyl cis-trans isomerase
MKLVSFAAIGMVLWCGIALAQDEKKEPPKPDTRTLREKASSIVGWGMAMQFKGTLKELRLDEKAMLEAFQQAMQDMSAIKPEEMQAKMKADEAVMKAYMDELTAILRKPGDDFLAENKKKKDVVTTNSGLQYKVLKQGKGKSPKATDQVKAHFRGMLIDGTEFDSSYKSGAPVTLSLQTSMLGMTEALQLMKVGDKWQIFLPTQLAFNDQPPLSMIPRFAALVFELELVDVLPPAANQPLPLKPQK